MCARISLVDFVSSQHGQAEELAEKVGKRILEPPMNADERGQASFFQSAIICVPRRLMMFSHFSAS